MKNIIPEMEESGGLIINISSGAGKTAYPPFSLLRFEIRNYRAY
jgi:NADP-dependent 3-hydroxy acid dehydrogenase YdfG